MSHLQALIVSTPLISAFPYLQGYLTASIDNILLA